MLSKLEKLMPEVRKISDRGLRRKVLEVWERALSRSSFTGLGKLPGEKDIDPNLSQLKHQRAVARMVAAVAVAIEEVVPDIKFDRDVLIAGALVHDVGKVFEYDPVRATAWPKRPRVAGFPSIRHPIYGVHLGLLVGLPEAVLHIIGAHAKEGTLVQRSLENTLVATVDDLFWELVAKSRTGLTVEDLKRRAVSSHDLRAMARKARGRK